MRVQIATRHCNVPKKVLDRTEEQVQRLTKFDTRISSAEVVFTEEKLDRGIEIILHIDRSEPLFAKGDGADFRTALDKAIDRLGRMVRKQRERQRDHKAVPPSDGIVSE